MSYLERLRQGEFSQKRPHEVLTKPTEAEGNLQKHSHEYLTKLTKPPLVSLVSSASGHVQENPTEKVGRWRVRVDGKDFSLIDPKGEPMEVIRKRLVGKFGAIEKLERYVMNQEQEK